MSKFIDWCIFRWFMPPEVKRGELSEEQFVTAMSKAYQNPAIEQYLNQREQYLISETANKVISGKMEEGRGVAGQLVEIRALRSRMRVCYTARQGRKSPAARRHSL